jgi:hypothetical protein
MSNPLFSTYSQGENRVTSSILAVLERLSFILVERILQALCQEPEFPLLTFINQPAGKSSTPDGRIRASFAYWIETKTTPNSINKDQICRHLTTLDTDTGVERKRLLVLTPDSKIPISLLELGDERVAWASFDNLLASIQEIVEPSEGKFLSDQVIPSEYERGMLRELILFLNSEGLIDRSTNRVVVVAARVALEAYLKHSAYICQPGRTFKPCVRLAFYTNSKIYYKVPKILWEVDEISQEEVEARADLDETRKAQLRALIKDLERLDSSQHSQWRDKAKIIFLSPPDSPDTLVLPHDIVNNLTSDAGRPIAFTQGQRYISLSRLEKAPKTTSELV